MKFLVFGLGGSPADLLRLGMEAGAAAPGASAAQVWAYVLSNGKTAGQNLVEINAGITALLARNCFDEQIQGSFTAADVLRILAAVAAGQTRITSHGGGAATVQFDAIDGSGLVVDASMQGSERTGVTLTPNESS